jgi:hypothetical protein
MFSERKSEQGELYLNFWWPILLKHFQNGPLDGSSFVSLPVNRMNGHNKGQPAILKPIPNTYVHHLSQAITVRKLIVAYSCIYVCFEKFHIFEVS